MKIQNIIGIFVVLLTYIVMGKADNVQSLELAIQTVSNIVVKYESKFDKRVQFHKLQDAIDAIDKAMLKYEGKAKSRLDLVRELNSDARQKYRECVGPIFEWCGAINGTIQVFVPQILDVSNTESDRQRLWKMVADILKAGTERAEKSLELLYYVQNRTAELKNLFESILHDVNDDFGPNGYYGKLKTELKIQKDDPHYARKIGAIAGIAFIFGAIGALIFGPIGLTLGLPAAALAFGIQTLADIEREKSLTVQIDVLNKFFDDLCKKIEEAKKTVDEIKKELDVDRSNLIQIKGGLLASDVAKDLIKMESPELRKRFIIPLNMLVERCHIYTVSHGAESPLRTMRYRREAIEIPEAEPLATRAAMSDDAVLQHISMRSTIGRRHFGVPELTSQFTPLPWRMSQNTHSLTDLLENHVYP